jgi:pyruvate formate lyase activating enzyme
MDAISKEDSRIVIARQLCSECEKQSCVDECYTEALKLSGREITVSRLMEIIQRDRHFWGHEGGITLTGGEPLLQLDFAKAILSGCHDAYIHTAIETCGNVPLKNFTDILPYTDWIFFDLKHLDSNEHMKGTGAVNKLILENAKLLACEYDGRLIFRFPLVPGFNDSRDNIDQVISFIKETGRNEINILPLHHLGSEKYRLLDNPYRGSDYPLPTNDNLRDIKNIFYASGIDCFIGSETPF